MKKIIEPVTASNFFITKNIINLLRKKILLSSLMLFFISTSYAAPSNPWTFTVAPYLWGMNMNGRVQTGPAKIHVNQTFGDILRQFQGGGMILFNAQKDKFGIFTNVLYSVLSDPISTTPVSASAHTHFGIFSAGVSYTAYEKTLANQISRFFVDPYLGARYTLNNTRLKVNSLSFHDNQHWTDPIVGMRLRYHFNHSWLAILSGDVGGRSINYQKSYNVQGYVGYHPTSIKNSTVYAGYRLLYQKYMTGNGAKQFDWDMKLFGPVIGMAFDF